MSPRLNREQVQRRLRNASKELREAALFWKNALEHWDAAHNLLNELQAPMDSLRASRRSGDDERAVGRVQQGAVGAVDSEAQAPSPEAGPSPSRLGPPPRVSLDPVSEASKDMIRFLVGFRCAEARKRIGHSQRSLAKGLGMSASWVREYENGGQFAPVWLLVVLSELAQVPIGWFFGYDLPDGGSSG